jgi:hypothetical protein
MAAGVSKQLGLCGASNNTQLEQVIGEYILCLTSYLTTRGSTSMVLQLKSSR